MVDHYQTAIGALVGAVVGWLGHESRTRLRRWADGRKVYRWLDANTKDAGGKSHKSTGEISDGVRLPEDRVLSACIAHKHIYRSALRRDRWSIHCKEPRSVYEDRGIWTV